MRTLVVRASRVESPVELSRGPIVPRAMPLAPGRHQPKDWPKAFAVFGQRILHARRHLREHLAQNDVVALQLSQLLSEHLLGRAG